MLMACSLSGYGVQFGVFYCERMPWRGIISTLIRPVSSLPVISRFCLADAVLLRLTIGDFDNVIDGAEEAAFEERMPDETHQVFGVNAAR